jgi:hypothetical protein
MLTDLECKKAVCLEGKRHIRLHDVEACTSNSRPAARGVGSTSTSSPARRTTWPSVRVADAQKAADSECAKYKRYTRLAIRPTPSTANYWVFDCVEQMVAASIQLGEDFGWPETADRSIPQAVQRDRLRCPLRSAT